MDGSSYFPSRPEMEANLEAFAERAGIAVRYDCRWERTRREDGPDGTVFTLETTDGEYRCRNLVLAVGVAQPWTPSHARHRARPPLRGDARGVDATPASGCSSSASRTPASSSRPASPRGRRRSPCARRRPPRPASRRSRWSASGRATSSRSRTTSWASASRILDASIDSIVHAGDALPRRTSSEPTTARSISVDADEVIAATGFTCPLLDLPTSASRPSARPSCPRSRRCGRAATVPGIYFAGHDQPGRPGPQKHGIPAVLRAPSRVIATTP